MINMMIRRNDDPYYVLICAWIMLMPWNIPKQEIDGATWHNLAEGAHMETWTIPLILMSSDVHRKSCEPIWASKCSVSTSGSIDRRTRWIDMVTKNFWWCNVFELFGSDNLHGKIRPWCLVLDPTRSNFELGTYIYICIYIYVYIYTHSILWYLMIFASICRITCETISAAKMELAPASDGQAFEESRLCHAACMYLVSARLMRDWIDLEDINHEEQSAHALSCLTTGPQHNLSQFMMHISSNHSESLMNVHNMFFPWRHSIPSTG